MGEKELREAVSRLVIVREAAKAGGKVIVAERDERARAANPLIGGRRSRAQD